MFKLSLAFSATLVSGVAVGDSTGYCTDLATQCPGAPFLPQDCNAAFSGYTSTADLGDDTDVDVNSIGCRWRFLKATGFNSTTDCRYASPSGGGRCGPVLDSTCKIAVGVCALVANASYTDEASCSSGLTALANQWGSLQGSDAGGDDSLECRLYHAYTSQKAGAIHCSHFGRTSDFCKGRVAPNAAHYCDVLQYNCNSANSGTAQFAQKAQCLATAAGYPSTTAADSGANFQNGANSLGCREYHAQAAYMASDLHCQHAGPSGGGACGSYQEAWGSMLAAAPCLDPHVGAFLTAVGNDTIVDTLIPKGPAGKYNTTLDTAGNTQTCRIYHLGVASTDTTHCAHGYVSGGATCGNSVDNLCSFIQGTCGFGTAAWQMADLNTCKTALATGLTQGITKPQDTSNNTFECRFYHATVAASYMTGASSGAVANATDKFQYHCGHVLKTSLAGGCGYVAPPSAAPASPTPAPSSAFVLSSVASLIAVAVSVFIL